MTTTSLKCPQPATLASYPLPRYSGGGLGWGLSRVIALIMVTLSATSLFAAPEPPTTPPRAFIQTILDNVTTILRNPQLNASQRSRAVREIAYANIDFETLSRLTLAQNWRALSPDKQTEFVREFRLHLSATYSHTTDDYDNERLTVSADRKEPNADWTVETKIVGTQQANNKPVDVKVDYRLRQKDNQWKVIDVTVDGISLVANFRSQFQEIISNGGIEQLLKLLREKNAAEAN
jgi:phospholipid transport system substrate-binding protein